MTRKKKRLALIASAMALVSIAVGLVMFALRDSVSLFATPSDIAEKSLGPGTHVRIGGLVKQGSYKREGEEVQFVVTDTKRDIPVRYDLKRSGPLPDLFREGQGVVAEGVLGQNGLAAATILAKHDERYMPREVVDALKKAGVWQEGQGPEGRVPSARVDAGARPQ
jgi:cytochrome c-type biogenesis protein CcmE